MKTNVATCSQISIRTLVSVAMLGAMSTILMLWEFPLWFAPPFYKIDLSEVPVLIGGFAFGPLGAVCIELIKILINFAINGTVTAGIGEIANFLIGCSLVVPASVVYRRWHTRKGAFLAMGLGTLVMVIIGAVMNAYILLPAYAGAFHIPISDLVAMGSQVNPKIHSLGSFIFFTVVPFNLIKGIVVGIITGLLYKHLSPILHGRQS